MKRAVVQGRRLMGPAGPADNDRVKGQVRCHVTAVIAVGAVVTLLLATGSACRQPEPGETGSEPVDDGPSLVASVAAPDTVWFTDRAKAVGIDFEHFNGRSGEFYFSEMMAPGAALFDFDNDGDLDIYLLQGQMLGSNKTLDDAVASPRVLPESLTDRLYRNDLEYAADGEPILHFTDVTAASGLSERSYGMGVATGDIDNDGWVDLYRTQHGPNQLFHNNGDGTFTDVSERSKTDDPAWGMSASFADIDRDGWLDLYVGNYVDYNLDDETSCATLTGQQDYCAPKSYPPAPDRVYRNEGDGTFADVTDTVLAGGRSGPALGVLAADLNTDGWVDIYVANDGEPNQLWINQQDGSFENGALLAGVAVNGGGSAEASMGVDAGDFDADGDDDLFMTHVSTETNTLFASAGSGFFEDRSAMVGLGAPSLAYTGFGTAWADLDNDGWLDLFVANGAVRVIEALVRAQDPFPLHQRNQLFRNLGNGRFEDVSAQAGSVFDLSEVSRGAAFGDIDNDGDMDVLVANNGGPARLLINEVGHHRHWVGLRLVGGVGPRDMLGARVGVVLDEGPTLWRRVHTDGSYASASDSRVLVGLGSSESIVGVTVVWPSGNVEEWTDVGIDRWSTLTEGTGRPGAD